MKTGKTTNLIKKIYYELFNKFKYEKFTYRQASEVCMKNEGYIINFYLLINTGYIRRTDKRGEYEITSLKFDETKIKTNFNKNVKIEKNVETEEKIEIDFNTVPSQDNLEKEAVRKSIYFLKSRGYKIMKEKITYEEI